MPSLAFSTHQKQGLATISALLQGQLYPILQEPKHQESILLQKKQVVLDKVKVLFYMDISTPLSCLSWRQTDM